VGPEEKRGGELAARGNLSPLLLKLNKEAIIFAGQAIILRSET
jgi:hypothetical protein